MSPPTEFSPKGRALRSTIGVFLIAVVFLLLFPFYGGAALYLVHAGIRGLADVAILAVFVAIAYVTFFAIIHFCFAIRRPLVCHGLAGTLSLLWLAIALPMSTPTEFGVSWLLHTPVV